MLQKIGDKWALVSKKTLRPLAYYKGEGKPPDSWVAEQEARIAHFKEEIKKDILPKAGAGQWGTDELDDTYREDTPGQEKKIKSFKEYKK